MKDQYSDALAQFNEDGLKRSLATAVDEGDRRRAAEIKSQLDALADHRETAVRPPEERT